VGVVILVAIAIVSAAIWHYRVPRFGVATVGATVSTELIFQLLAYLEAGYLDAFFLIAAFTSALLALAISIIVGLPIRARRKRGELGNRAA
jgi:hypothetical protein